MRRALQPRAIRDFLILVLLFTTAACHKKQVAIPLPAQPAPSPAMQAPEIQAPELKPAAAAPSTIPEPPPIMPPPAPKEETKYQKNKTPEQSGGPKRTSRPTTSQPAAPQGPVPASSTPPPEDPPHLGDLLTPEQQRQYNAAIEQSLAHAQASLASVGNRPLTKEQETTLAQCRNFIEQAQEKRKDDELAAAKSLAERAEVLAHDLAASLN